MLRKIQTEKKRKMRNNELNPNKQITDCDFVSLKNMIVQPQAHYYTTVFLHLYKGHKPLPYHNSILGTYPHWDLKYYPHFYVIS